MVVEQKMDGPEKLLMGMAGVPELLPVLLVGLGIALVTQAATAGVVTDQVVGAVDLPVLDLPGLL